MAPFRRSLTSSYSPSIVTITVCCAVFGTNRDINGKTPTFHTRFHLTCMITWNPFEFFSKMLTRTVQLYVNFMWRPYCCLIVNKQAVQLGGRHNMPPPRDLDFGPFDLEVGVGVACDLGYPCASFVFLGLLVFELEPMYATSDRRTTITA